MEVRAVSWRRPRARRGCRRAVDRRVWWRQVAVRPRACPRRLAGWCRQVAGSLSSSSWSPRRPGTDAVHDRTCCRRRTWRSGRHQSTTTYLTQTQLQFTSQFTPPDATQRVGGGGVNWVQHDTETVNREVIALDMTWLNSQLLPVDDVSSYWRAAARSSEQGKTLDTARFRGLKDTSTANAHTPLLRFFFGYDVYCYTSM